MEGTQSAPVRTSTNPAELLFWRLYCHLDCDKGNTTATCTVDISGKWQVVSKKIIIIDGNQWKIDYNSPAQSEPVVAATLVVCASVNQCTHLFDGGGGGGGSSADDAVVLVVVVVVLLMVAVDWPSCGQGRNQS